MPQNQAANNFQTTLKSSATSSQTTLELTTLAGAPSYPYLLTLTPAGGSPPFASYEVVAVTSLSSGTTVNVTRGVEGTAAAWSSGDTATIAFTAGEFGSLLQRNWPADASWMIVGPANTSMSNTSSSGSGSFSNASGLGQVGITGATASSNAYRVFGGGSTSAASSAWDPTVGNGYGWIGQFNIEGAPAAAGDLVVLALVDSYSPPPGGVGFQVSYSGGSLLTQIYSSGTLTASAVQVSAPGWHRFAILAKGASTTVAIDGVEAGTIAAVPGRGNAWIVAGAYVANGTAGTKVQLDLGPTSIVQSFT